MPTWHLYPSNITTSWAVEVMFATEEAMAVRATGTQGIPADRGLHRRARCGLLMKGMAHSSSNRSTTRQKPDDTLYFKLGQVGVKREAAESKSEFENPLFISSF